MENTENIEKILKELKSIDPSINENDETLKKIVSNMLENKPNMEIWEFNINLKNLIMKEVKLNNKLWSFNLKANLVKIAILFAASATLTFWALSDLETWIPVVDNIKEQVKERVSNTSIWSSLGILSKADKEAIKEVEKLLDLENTLSWSIDYLSGSSATWALNNPSLFWKDDEHISSTGAERRFGNGRYDEDEDEDDNDEDNDEDKDEYDNEDDEIESKEERKWYTWKYENKKEIEEKNEDENEDEDDNNDDNNDEEDSEDDEEDSEDED